jgi:hypothetical protein
VFSVSSFKNWSKKKLVAVRLLLPAIKRENTYPCEVWREESRRHRGSMLWSQFSAISTNWPQKSSKFLENRCYDGF